ncbi:Coiled-coil domain-containing protein 11, partial [Globisporangium splendens]
MAAAFSARSSAAGQGGRGVGESLILKRRQRETHLASYVDCVKGLTKANSRAEWEHSLHTRAEGTQVQRTLHHLKDHHESQLHSRRLRLAELYNSEMEAWKEECLANVETPEDRKQKMIQMALELKARRERERRVVVEEKRLQQYRESCDDCRVEDSRKVQTYVLQDRDKQLDERKRLQEDEACASRVFEARMAQLWEEDRLKKEEHDRMDREMAIKRNEEVKAILDLQVDLYRKSKNEEEAHKKAEDRALLDEWHRLRQVEEELELQNKQNEINRAMDVEKFNQERVEASRYAVERERQYDIRLLELALAQESEAQRREREQQEKFKQEQLEHQRMLRKQMDAEAEDLTYLDRIRKDMEDQVWAKRDAQHNAEEAARQELLRQVLISRANQTELKQKNQLQKKQEDPAYMEQIKRETEEALQKELREQEERRAELKRNQSDLVKQLEERRIADEQKRQAEYLEFKRMQLAEKQHKERVQQFAANAPPMTYRRKTAQWYCDA